MSDTLDWFMRDVDAGFQPSYGDSVAALDALREARAEIDALRARAERAEKERDEARKEAEGLRYDNALVRGAAKLECDDRKRAEAEAAALRKVREAAERVSATWGGGESLERVNAIKHLRSALTAARGEVGE
jgi:hypothetical protein